MPLVEAHVNSHASWSHQRVSSVGDIGGHDGVRDGGCVLRMQLRQMSIERELGETNLPFK